MRSTVGLRLKSDSPNCCLTSGTSFSFISRYLLVFFLRLSIRFSFSSPSGKVLHLPARNNHLCRRALGPLLTSIEQPLWPRGRLRCYAQGPALAGEPHSSLACLLSPLMAASRGALVFQKQKMSISGQLHVRPCHWLPKSRSRDVPA